MTLRRDATIGFVQNTQSIVGAVDMLKAAIAGGDADDISFAADLVAKAADDYSGTSAEYGRFGLDEIAAPADREVPDGGRGASSLLASALLDLEVGNTLMVAGRLVEAPGQTAGVAEVGELEQTAEELSNTIKAVSSPLGRGAGRAAAPARFGFDEIPPPPSFTPSPDLETAKSNFNARVGEFLSALVAESRSVVAAAYEGIEKFDYNKILEVLGTLGTAVTDLPHVGKLIAKGFSLVVQALGKITELLGAQNAQKLRELAEKIFKLVKERADPLEKFLEYSYAVPDVKKYVADLIEQTPADREKLDAGAKRLADLKLGFTEHMVLLTRIVKGANTGKGIADFFLPQATTVAVFGSFYLLAMDYAVLRGMDYADTAGIFDFVEGVIRISESTLR